MCLAVPGKVIKIKNNIATIDYGSEKREVQNYLFPQLKVGQYVLVSQKIIMEIVNEKHAKKSIALWNSAIQK